MAASSSRADMKACSPWTGSMRVLPGCSSRRQMTDDRSCDRPVCPPTSDLCPLLRPPTHLMDRCARAPVHRFAANHEILVLVETNSPCIVLVDMQIESVR